jgi:hypothetical protein
MKFQRIFLSRLKFILAITLLSPVAVFAQTITTAINPVLTAVGLGNNGTGFSFPLLAVSTDGNASWAVHPTPGLPRGAFNASSCTGSGSTAICAAVGIGYTTDIPFIPLLSVSTNGGIDWTVPIIPNLPREGRFLATSCTGSGSTAVCTAAGSVESARYPLLAVSANGGKNWEIKSIAGPYGYFQTTSCTGSGSTAIFIAAGNSASDLNPMLAVSTNGGETWVMQAIPGLPAKSLSFLASSCTGSGTSAICIAAGMAIDNPTPLLVVSTDGGRNWSLKSIAGLLLNNYIYATSCTGSGPTAICIAAGMSGVRTPLLAVSTDGGASWSAKSIPNLQYGKFVASSCTGSGSTAVCTAAGEGGSNLNPLFVVSRNGGKDWSIQPITGLPAISAFKATSCTGSGSTAICTAAGQSSGYPLLAASIDGGMNWAVQSVNGILAGGFNGSAATSSAGGSSN